MAYDFVSASTQYLSTASAPVAGVPLTLACWFRPNNITQNCILLDLSDAGGAQRFTLAALGGVAGDPIRADALSSGAGAPIDTTSGYSANIWQHACAVFVSNTSRSVYLNGGSKATSTATLSVGTVTTLRTGVRFASNLPGLYMEGAIAEVGVWNAALTDQEIASLAAGMKPSKIRPQSIRFYGPLIRSLQDVARANTITNTNGATVTVHPRVY